MDLYNNGATPHPFPKFLNHVINSDITEVLAFNVQCLSGGSTFQRDSVLLKPVNAMETRSTVNLMRRSTRRQDLVAFVSAAAITQWASTASPAFPATTRTPTDPQSACLAPVTPWAL